MKTYHIPMDENEFDIEERQRRERVAQIGKLRKKIERETGQAFFVIIAILISTFISTLLALENVFPWFEYVSSFVSQFWINLIGVILIAVIGIFLYLLRERKRTIYGTIEVGFALAYGWYAINKVTTVGYVETLSVIAAIYLVVRGLDNIMQERKRKINNSEKQILCKDCRSQNKQELS